jgi:hypothetical protein
MSTTKTALLFLCATSLALGACGDKDDGGSGDVDTGTSTGGDTSGDGSDGSDGSDGADGGGDEGGDEGDSGTAPDPITASVQGTVTVELYKVEDGDRVSVDWADFSSDFPFGPIFVAAYEDDGAGNETYVGTDSIWTPTQSANAFDLSVSMDEEGPVKLYAMLDENGNRIMESDEPIGAWNAEVEIVDGGLATGVDIVVLVDVSAYLNGGDDGGGSGGEGCDEVTTSGPVTVTTSFQGEGLAMLTNLDGTGPVAWDWFEVTPTTGGEGGSSSYEITTCANLGNVQLTGAIDSNGNSLIDPADTTGAYVTAPDTNGNPIVVGTSDLTNYEVQIPITGPDGEEEDYSVSIVPFVTISGTVTYESSRIDGLPSGSAVYVAALKYRPNTGVSAAGLATDAYDLDTFDWSADINGNASVSYSLVVPAGQTVYLWSYADTDLDGNVNESGEPVSSAGSDSGAYETTSSSTTQDLDLRVVGM